jgi:hypothetical protein
LDVLRSDSRKNGWVLETAPIAAYAGGGVDAELDRFANAVLEKSQLDASRINMENPEFTYRSLTGHVLEITYRPHKSKYSGQHKIDGKPVDYMTYPLFGNPWVRQPLGADKLEIRHGEISMAYDFVNWTKAETPAKQSGK